MSDDPFFESTTNRMTSKDVATSALLALKGKVPGVKVVRGKCFVQIEDVLVCKAFCGASCDSIVGNGQKGNVFRDKMYACYLLLLKEQALYDRSRLKSLSVAGRVPEQSNDDNETPFQLDELYDLRTAASIYDRFKKHLGPRCSKFLAIASTTEMESGWNDDMHYKACCEHYKSAYPALGDPDLMRPCIEYLKTKPKWKIYNKELIDNERAGTSATKTQRPLGNKKAKAQKKEDETIGKVVSSLGLVKTEPGVVTVTPAKAKSDATEFFSKCGDMISSVMKHIQTKQDREDMELMSTPEKETVKKQLFAIRKMERELVLQKLTAEKEAAVELAVELAAKRRKLSIPTPVVTVGVVSLDVDDSESVSAIAET